MNTNDLNTKISELEKRIEFLEQKIQKIDLLFASKPPKPAPDDDLDAIFNDAVKVVTETGIASASFLQRRLMLGYARAARLLDQLERKGIVGPQIGINPRKILKTQKEV